MFALCLAPAFAQTTTGSVFGTVTDSTGRAVTGAAVTAEQPDLGSRRTAITDATGFYRIPALAPASWRITAAAPNLEAAPALVSLGVDSRVRQDFALTPAAIRQSLTVSSRIKSIETESPAVGFILDRDRIASLPLNRRDFLFLSFLAPGALPPVQDSELSSRGSFAVHASGGREEFNNFTLDGADNNDPYTNRHVLQPSLESIQEFKLLTNSYSAEYGRSAGAQVNIVTRSGTNALHGSLYEYLRNRVLDARNYFDPRQPPGLTRNQFGGTLGGPLRRDRSFLFLSYEGLEERRVLTRLAATPTAAERSGDLSAFTRPIIDPFAQRPFPGNRIPASRIHRLAPRVLDLFNLPVAPGLRDGSRNLNTRFDHHLSTRDELTVRYAWGSQALLEPFAEEATDVPGFGNLVDNSGHNISARHVRVWNGATIQTSRFTYNRSFRRAVQQNQGTNVGQLWGVSWLPAQPRDYGYPSIKIAGYSQIGDVDQLPLERTNPVIQFHEALSLVRGRHSVKAGGEYRRLGADGYLDYFGRGTLTFSGQITGAGIGDTLLGFPTFGLQSRFDNRQSLRSQAVNLFLHDDWRLTARLNLSLGLRYEYNSPATDPEDRMYALNLAATRLDQVGTNGVPRAGMRGDRNNFAPRIGIAWSPTANWVLRSGYGVFYDSGMFVVNSSFYFNPPLFNVRIFFPTATSLLTLDNPFPVTGGVTPAPSPNTLSPDITTAYLQQWNLAVERQISPASTLTVAYAGTKGTHLIRSRDRNQPAPGPGAVQQRRPIPQFAGIFFSESSGNSVFQSLQAHYDRRLARGWSVIASYTWAHSIDDTSAFLGTKADKNFPQNSRDWRAERALSSYDMRHRFSTAALWQFHGFETRAIVSAQTGQPFTPLLRFDNSNTGNSGSIFGNDRPNLLRNSRLANRTPERWFDTTAFAIPSQYSFGNAGRNIVLGPAFVNLDFGVARRFRASDRVSVTIDAQAFNLTNTAHFDLPERYADEPTSFGRILSAKPPRQLQLGLRLSF